MIGDDVGFRRRSTCRPIRILQHAWARLQCHVYGHFYRPSYLMWGQRAQYTCECCGEKTKWMSKHQHALFNLEFCPTWGDRGSDSQNYRFVGPPEPVVKRHYSKRQKERYKLGHRS